MKNLDDILCPIGENGRHAGLKILFTVMWVMVQIHHGAQRSGLLVEGLLLYLAYLPDF